MTDSDLSEFFTAVEGLFPGKLTSEQVRVWTANIRNLPATEAHSALNEYYAKGKTPSDGPIPALPGFMRCIRAARESNGTHTASNRCHPNDPEWLHAIRHQIIKHVPSADAWTMADVRNEYLSHHPTIKLPALP